MVIGTRCQSELNEFQSSAWASSAAEQQASLLGGESSTLYGRVQCQDGVYSVMEKPLGYVIGEQVIRPAINTLINAGDSFGQRLSRLWGANVQPVSTNKLEDRSLDILHKSGDLDGALTGELRLLEITENNSADKATDPEVARLNSRVASRFISKWKSLPASERAKQKNLVVEAKSYFEAEENYLSNIGQAESTKAAEIVAQIADLKKELGDWEGCLSDTKKSLDIHGASSSPEMIARSYERLGDRQTLALKDGVEIEGEDLLTSAEKNYKEALDFFTNSEKWVDEARLRKSMGSILSLKKNFPEAIEEAKQALNLVRNNSIDLEEIATYCEALANLQASAWKELHDKLPYDIESLLDEADKNYEEAESILHRENPVDAVKIVLSRADILVLKGYDNLAIKKVKEGSVIAEEQDAREQRIRCYTKLGDLLSKKYSSLNEAEQKNSSLLDEAAEYYKRGQELSKQESSSSFIYYWASFPYVVGGVAVPFLWKFGGQDEIRRITRAYVLQPFGACLIKIYSLGMQRYSRWRTPELHECERGRVIQRRRSI